MRILLVALSLLLAGCAATPTAVDPGPATPGTGSGGATIDPRLLAPLEALGPCPSLPAGEPHDEVPGLVLPDGAVVTQVEDLGTLTNVQGWIPLTPIEVRVSYLDRPGLTVIQAEDEVREAEVLVGDGEYRLFVKAQAICRRGSVFVAIVAPEVAADAVPTPTGTG